MENDLAGHNGCFETVLGYSKCMWKGFWFGCFLKVTRSFEIIGHFLMESGDVNAFLGVFWDCLSLFWGYGWFGSRFSLVAS